ncbi:hypothetical protein N9087_00285 [bacterium]|nr:hypothetical protein [bacterium]
MTAEAKDCDDKAFSALQTNAVRLGVVLVVIAFLVRGAVCWRNLEQFSADPDAYRAIAETLGVTGVFGLTAASGETIATAFRPPLYPTVLAWFLDDQQLPNAAVASLHTALGMLAVLFTYLAGLSMLPKNTGLWGPSLAAVLVMVDPLLLKQSTVLMTETLATTLVCMVIWWWSTYRNRIHDLMFGLGLGGLLSLAFLARPTFIVWAVLLVLSVFVFEVRGLVTASKIGASKIGASKKNKVRRRVVPLVVFSAGLSAVLVVVVGGWTWRNTRAVGYPVWATTHGGYTLLLGNNPSFYDFLRSGSDDGLWDSAPFQIAYSHRYDGDPRSEGFWQQKWNDPREIQDQSVVAVVTEHSDDLLAYDSAKAVIQRQPEMFLWAAAVRLCRLWSPFPNPLGGRSSTLLMLTGLYCCCLYIAMLIGCFRLGRCLLTSRWLPVLTLFVTLSAVHAFYWSNIRMRAPAIPAIALLAAVAIPPLRNRATALDEDEPGGLCG